MASKRDGSSRCHVAPETVLQLLRGALWVGATAFWRFFTRMSDASCRPLPGCPQWRTAKWASSGGAHLVLPLLLSALLGAAGAQNVSTPNPSPPPSAKAAPPAFNVELDAAWVFLDLAVIMLVCRFVGIVFKSLGQPSVIGEIIAGASAHVSAQRRRAGGRCLVVQGQPLASGGGTVPHACRGCRTRSGCDGHACSGATRYGERRAAQQPPRGRENAVRWRSLFVCCLTACCRTQASCWAPPAWASATHAPLGAQP